MTPVGPLTNGSPLSAWLDGFGAEAATSMRAALVTAVASGQAPRQVAATLAAKVDLSGARLLAMTRTTIFDSYRSATLAAYQANDDIIDGWEWLSAQDERCCLACLGLDGQTFPLSTAFQPCHVGCRCTSLASLKGIGTPERKLASDWLAGQPEETQRKMLPVSAYEAYRDGSLSLDDFVGLDKNARWGDRYRQASVAEARANAVARVSPAIDSRPAPTQRAPARWEAPELQQLLPREIARLLNTTSDVLAVPSNVAAKIGERHAADRSLLAQLGDLLERWEILGPSPKDVDRIEVYGRLEGVWVTAVIKADHQAGLPVLTTFHRIYARKVESRRGKGYLTPRETGN